MDLFVVPTLAFNLLYGLIIVRLDRRELVWIAVTNSPTADWIARQITEAFPWESAPRYLIRDETASSVPSCDSASAQWAFGINLSLRARHGRIEPREVARHRIERPVHEPPNHAQLMVLPDPRLQIHVAEQRTRSLIRSAQISLRDALSGE